MDAEREAQRVYTAAGGWPGAPGEPQDGAGSCASVSLPVSTCVPSLGFAHAPSKLMIAGGSPVSPPRKRHTQAEARQWFSHQKCVSSPDRSTLVA